MTAFWVDPVNTDAQFLNMMGLALSAQNPGSIIRSNKRKAFEPPTEIQWENFSSLEILPQSISGSSTRFLFSGLYPYYWMRSIFRLKSEGFSSVLFSTHLKLPAIDTNALRFLQTLKIKPVVICHRPHPYVYENANRNYAKKYKGFYEAASRILVINQFVKNLLKEYFQIEDKKISIFAHPHFNNLLQKYQKDESLALKLQKWSNHQPVISYISNFSEEHGLSTLLNHLDLVKKKIPDVKFLIVTRISENIESSKQSLIESLQKFPFFQKDVFLHFDSYTYPQLLSFFDITSLVVTPYAWAAQSGVISMSLGLKKPVVSSNVGGLPKMISQGECGILIPPKNPQALATACATILNPNNYSGFCLGAEQFATERLSHKKAIDIFLESLES